MIRCGVDFRCFDNLRQLMPTLKLLLKVIKSNFSFPFFLRENLNFYRFGSIQTTALPSFRKVVQLGIEQKRETIGRTVDRVFVDPVVAFFAQIGNKSGRMVPQFNPYGDKWNRSLLTAVPSTVGNKQDSKIKGSCLPFQDRVLLW
jgi:hypothetical protein